MARLDELIRQVSAKAPDPDPIKLRAVKWTLRLEAGYIASSKPIRGREAMKPYGSALAFGLRPWSVSAFTLALSLLVAAIALRMLLSYFGANFYFGTFLPAILAASFFAGVPSGIFAAVLSIPIVWWMFLPPAFAFSRLTVADYNQFAEFMLVSLLLVWFAHLCRQAP